MKKLLLLTLLFFPFKLFAKDLNIITTIKPIHSIINGIIGKYHQNHLLIGKNQSIHDYHLKPSDINKVNNADIIFLIDFDFEFYLKKLHSKLSSKTQTIELSSIPNLNIVSLRNNTLFIDEHEHSHDHLLYDYHIWLDVDNVITIVKYIAEVISSYDPDNQLYYMQNAVAIINQLKELDYNIQSKLRKYSEIPYLVSHDAYQYFEKNYNLNSIGAISINPEANISLKKISELKNLIEKNNVKCIFIEPNYSEKTINKLVDITNIYVETLDPEWGSDKQFIDGYIELMENLGNNLTRCLSKD